MAIMPILEPYLAPLLGALALYVYLFMEEKITFHTLHLLIYLFIGAMIGSWSVELLASSGVNTEVASGLGGFLGILAPQIMETLVNGNFLKEGGLIKRILTFMLGGK